MGSAVHTIEMPDLPFQSEYDFSRIDAVCMDGDPARCILSGKNAEKARNDIGLCVKDASIKLQLTDIKFAAPQMHHSVNSDFTHVTLAERTRTGKIARYPLRLYFTTNNDLSRDKSYYTGQIFYLRNGEIGKYEINYWKRINQIEMDRTVCKGDFTKK